MTNRLASLKILGVAAFSGFLALQIVPVIALADSADGVVLKQISFAEFKDRCTNPQKYPDIQVAPQHTVFQCQADERDWVAVQPGTIPLPSDSVIQGAVISDKFAVSVDHVETVIPNKGGSCLRFKEVQRTMKLEAPVACGDLAKIDSAVEYCQLATQSAKGANPKLVTSKDTGLVVDTCNGAAPKPSN